MEGQFFLRTDTIYNEVNDRFEVYGIYAVADGVTMSCPAMFINKRKALDFIEYINRDDMTYERLSGILDWYKNFN